MALLVHIDEVDDDQAAQVAQSTLAQLEAVTNELTGRDLSSQLSEFFNAFSEVANDPTSSVVREAAVEQGASVASFIRGLREDVLRTREPTYRQLADVIMPADDALLSVAARVAEL